MALNATSAQNFVPIKEIRDGVIILKDGSLRMVLLASSINLALKSSDEQQAIIMQFQNFLNSLDFSTQIVIQSRRYDVRPYLATLEEMMAKQTEPLLKVQTKEYMEFIREFSDTNAIMKKQFFLCVPYGGSAIVSQSGILKKFLPGKDVPKTTPGISDKEADFEESRSQLEQRIGVIEQGLARCGIRTARLGTEEVVEVFYKWFNPGESAQSVMDSK